MSGKKKTLSLLPVDIAIGVVKKEKRNNKEIFNISIYFLDPDNNLILDNRLCDGTRLYDTMIVISDFYYHLYDRKVLFTDSFEL